ncbi:hypothetical protein BJV78DRAFT_1178805 [Lactifluus subvellereus]|nr:hypothetical protein BJV78DRAFT_1178805 [Lactifluus subvellereus]
MLCRLVTTSCFHICTLHCPGMPCSSAILRALFCKCGGLSCSNRYMLTALCIVAALARLRFCAFTLE